MTEPKPLQAEDLPLTPVDADSPVPLYYQIEADLRRLINAGTLPPGATLPPELELCRAYDVGRHTMRMALSRLAADDLIARYAGRGTFVKPQSDRKQFYLDRSFTRQMADMGRQARSEILELMPETIAATAPQPLRNHQGQRSLRLVRLRFGDDEPIGLQCSTIITELCPELDQYDFEQASLYDILARHYNLVISKIHYTVSAVAADQFQAELLQISEGDPLLLVNTTTFLDTGQLIEYTTSYYRADKYEYSTTHTYSA